MAEARLLGLAVRRATRAPTANDSSDNAIPTALANGVTWTTGRLGGAIDFPGGAAGATGPTVTLGDNPLAACTNQLTVVRVGQAPTRSRRGAASSTSAPARRASSTSRRPTARASTSRWSRRTACSTSSSTDRAGRR